MTASLQDSLSPVERFNLVSDTWASVTAGLTPVPDFLALAKLFTDETDRNVWVALLGGLDVLNRYLAPADRPKLQALSAISSGRRWRGSAGSGRPASPT